MTRFAGHEVYTHRFAVSNPNTHLSEKKKFHILLSMQDTNIINFDDIVNEDKLVNNTN